MAEPTRPRGIILAGGRSRRMGRDKALMLWRGRTLLDRARDLLRAAGASEMVVLGRSGVAGGVADLAPGEGPAAALEHYLAAHPLDDAAIAVVVPIDMPGLHPALLAPLVAAAPAHYDGYPLPLALKGDVPPFGGRSLKSLLAACGAARLDPPGDAPLRLANLNTPEAWAEAERVLPGGERSR